MIVGVRHARVWNPDGLVYASLPGFQLSEDGRAAATELSASLASSPVRAVYASPLDRAMETASILAAPHGLAVAEDRRLIEWAFWSHWQGMAWTKIRERDPDRLEVYGEDPARACPEEPLQTVGERVLEWAVEAELSHPDGLVLGVSHEAPLIAASLVGSGRDVSGFHATNLPHLGTVRLRPGPAEVVDLAEWARTC
jgi:broad specificity phosphatase PhoE